MPRRILINLPAGLFLWSMLCLIGLELVPVLDNVVRTYLSEGLSALALFKELAAFGIPIAVAVAVRLFRRENPLVQFKLKAVPLKYWPFIITVALWLPVTVAVINLLFYIFTPFSVLPEQSEAGLSFLSLCVVPALFEEGMVRGLVLSPLRRGGNFFAVVFSSVCFAMLHGSTQNFLGPLLAGLVLSVLTIMFDSIIPAIVVHFVNNAFSFFTAEIVKNLGASLSPYALLVIVAGAFLILLYATLSRLSDVIEMGRGELKAVYTVREKGQYIFSVMVSLPFLAFAVLFFRSIGTGA